MRYVARKEILITYLSVLCLLILCFHALRSIYMLFLFPFQNEDPVGSLERMRLMSECLMFCLSSKLLYLFPAMSRKSSFLF